MKNVLLILLLIITLGSCQKENNNSNNANTGNTTTGTALHSCGAKDVHNPTKSYGTVKDIVGYTYKTIQIGSQNWMAENLKTTKYRNGVSISDLTDANL